MKKERVYSGIIEGAKEVMHHHQNLNKINVFPVPDGDTGSNLFSTMSSIVNHSELRSSTKHTFESVADAAIIGSRGNSGIIFASYFLGLSSGLYDDEITPEMLISASETGTRYATEAVEIPVEGTVLTVMKVFHETLRRLYRGNFEDALEKAYHSICVAVEKTTQQLKVLKKSGVVDAGAKGFQYFIKGFIKGIHGEIQTVAEPVEALSVTHGYDANYRYCTELLVAHNRGDLKALLSDLGDSLVTLQTENKGRVHIHTNKPHLVFERVSNLGKIIETKVEDMFMQNKVVHHRKHPYVIVTDSIADLPQSIIDEEQIQVMPLPIMVDNVQYLDKLTIKNERVLSLMSKKPTSSMPNRRKIEQMYEYLSQHYDEILVISVAKGLSGTYQTFLKAVANQKHIHVIDSKQNSVAQGVLVSQAAAYLNQGMDLDEVQMHIKTDIEHSKIMVVVNSIDAMIASGRLPEKIGRWVKKIGLKPIITLKEGKGHIQGVSLNFSSGIRRMIRHLKKMNRRYGLKQVGITYVDDIEQAILIQTKLKKAQIDVAYVVQSSSIIANGAGSGAVAIGYIRER